MNSEAWKIFVGISTTFSAEIQRACYQISPLFKPEISIITVNSKTRQKFFIKENLKNPFLGTVVDQGMLSERYEFFMFT